MAPSTFANDGTSSLETTVETLLAADDGRPLVMHAGRVVTIGEFRERAARFASVLPADGGALLNLCEDRFRFLVAYVGAASRGWTNLLPPSRAVDAITEVAARHPGAVTCDDVWVDAALAAAKCPAIRASVPPWATTVAYTSGSTGAPQPNAKSWSSLELCTRAKAGLLGVALPGFTQAWIVATVPPQHMYGLEFSVLLPLMGSVAVHGGRPLLPVEVSEALTEVPAPRILVTTPLHLRVLVESGVQMPTLALVISATAPLESGTAQKAEAAWRCRVLEVFGSTETCAIARRDTARQSLWDPFDGVSLVPDEDSTQVSAGWLAAPTKLQDVVELEASGGFAVLGRSSDMIEVAGKRASLGDLTRRLLGVAGVRDAVLVQSDSRGTATRRVAAMVVAPGLTSAEILARLRGAMDPVFLPRPLVIVDELPRSEVGKVSREKVMETLVRGFRSKRAKRPLC